MWAPRSAAALRACLMQATTSASACSIQGSTRQRSGHQASPSRHLKLQGCGADCTCAPRSAAALRARLVQATTSASACSIQGLKIPNLQPILVAQQACPAYKHTGCGRNAPACRLAGPVCWQKQKQGVQSFGSLTCLSFGAAHLMPSRERLNPGCRVTGGAAAEPAHRCSFSAA